MKHLTYKDLKWHPQPNGEALVRSQIDFIASKLSDFSAYVTRLRDATGVRVRDIIDTIAITTEELPAFEKLGWVATTSGLWRNDAGIFPTVYVGEQKGLWLRVEHINSFVEVTAPDSPIEGEPFAPLRKAIVYHNDTLHVGGIERNGTADFEVRSALPTELRATQIYLNAFRARRREFDTVEAGLDSTEMLIDGAVAELGPHRSCALWLQSEREFWMRRCHAGRLQKERQDKVGIGWSNIDHHTYDSTRQHFRQTIRMFKKLGYELREMLYAGELAGWGSQVLWQPVIGSTIFADIDLAPDELIIDFAHEPLPAMQKHRRAGLLCALLGESVLEAGLNHVAALYDHRLLRTQLAKVGVTMMPPFSDFDHLYQELTLGDWGAVNPLRVDALEAKGHISATEAEKLKLDGSIITHLENIERNDGYKGFNREGIDSVLRKLDPRAYPADAT